MHSVLTEKVQEIKKNFLQESGIQFSELEEKVLQFHLSNLEYACGSTLDQVGGKNPDSGGSFHFCLVVQHGKTIRTPRIVFFFFIFVGFCTILGP